MNGSTMFNYQWDALDFLRAQCKLKNYRQSRLFLVIIKLSLSVLVKFILYSIDELLMWNSDKACQKATLLI